MQRPVRHCLSKYKRPRNSPTAQTDRAITKPTCLETSSFLGDQKCAPVAKKRRRKETATARSMRLDPNWDPNSAHTSSGDSDSDEKRMMKRKKKKTKRRYKINDYEEAHRDTTYTAAVTLQEQDSLPSGGYHYDRKFEGTNEFNCTEQQDQN